MGTHSSILDFLKWIRVTDDERNVRWVGVNVDPQQVQAAIAQDPAMQQRIAGVIGNVAELDCDIIIDEAPDALTPQLEQFQSLVELKKFDANGEVPFKSIVRASPNLKVKQQILKDMEDREKQNAQGAQAKEQLRFRAAAAEVAETESKAALNMAKSAGPRHTRSTSFARLSIAAGAAEHAGASGH